MGPQGEGNHYALKDQMRGTEGVSNQQGLVTLERAGEQSVSH